MLSLLGTPHSFFVAGGLVGGITIYLIDTLKDKFETPKKRFLDACIGGLSSMAICWLANSFFPDKFSPVDSIPYAVGIAVLGTGRVFKALAKRAGLDLTDSEDDKQ